MTRDASLASILSIAFCLLTGCGQTILVKRAPYATNAGDLGGIPFYVKNALCKRQTTWLQPVYVLTLKVSFTPQKSNPEVEPLSSTRTVVLTLNEYQMNAVSELYKAINAGKTNSAVSRDEIKDIEEKWTAVQTLSPADPCRLDENQLDPQVGADRNRVLMVANEAVAEVYVDYSTIYVYNTSKPWAGSSQASIKLAPDGTMTEASGQQESKTLQAFLDLLPIKGVLTGLAKGAIPAVGFVAAAQGSAKYELSTDVTIWRHTHYIFETIRPPCPPPQARVTTSPYNVTVEDVSGAKKGSPKDNEISVSGSIQLPKKDQTQPQKKE